MARAHHHQITPACWPLRLYRPPTPATFTQRNTLQPYNKSKNKQKTNKQIMTNLATIARRLRDGILKTGHFEILSKDVGVPLVAFRLLPRTDKDSGKQVPRAYDEYDISDKLKEHGWVLPVRSGRCLLCAVWLCFVCCVYEEERDQTNTPPNQHTKQRTTNNKGLLDGARRQARQAAARRHPHGPQHVSEGGARGRGRRRLAGGARRFLPACPPPSHSASTHHPLPNKLKTK